MRWLATLAVMRRWFVGMALVGGCLFVPATVALAAPLVTGDLAVYYDFDEDWTAVVTDGSGNNIDGEIQVDGRVYRSDLAKRGEGSAVFDPLGYFLPDVDPETIDPTAYPDDAILMGTENPPGWGPAVTMAAWLKLTRYSDPGGNGTVFCDPSCAKDQAQGIIQIKSAAGSYVTHFETKPWGTIRGQLRGEIQSQNIASPAVYTDGSTTNTAAAWPNDEWFHFAQVYDSKGTFWGVPGYWAMYYNGQKIIEGYAQNGPDDPGAIDLGGWGMGAFIGRVEDDNRQVNGYMDEIYIFTRALSGEEIGTLYRAYHLGDMNDDDLVNGLDVNPFVHAVISEPFNLRADMNGDGAVTGLDVAPFVAAVIAGSAQPVPEPCTAMLSTIALLSLLCWRRKGQ